MSRIIRSPSGNRSTNTTRTLQVGRSFNKTTKPIEINGVYYPSISVAISKLGISRYQLTKRLNNNVKGYVRLSS